MDNAGVWRSFSIICYFVAVVFIGFGFHRIYAYDNPEYRYSEPVNVWVGGDAYNYIINGTHAIAFMILALMFVLAGLALELIIRIEKHKDTLKDSVENNQNLVSEEVLEEEVS